MTAASAADRINRRNRTSPTRSISLKEQIEIADMKKSRPARKQVIEETETYSFAKDVLTRENWNQGRL